MLLITYNIINEDYFHSFLPVSFNVLQPFPQLVVSFDVIPSGIDTEYKKTVHKITGNVFPRPFIVPMLKITFNVMEN